ncbi:MAG: glycosyltransferase family 4 protein [Paracraurococcus sp.]
MKILFVSTLYQPYAIGGAEATVKLLAEGAVRGGDAAVVVTLTPGRGEEQRVVDGIRVRYLPLFNVFFPHGQRAPAAWRKPAWHLLEAWNPVMARRLAAVVAEEAPDVVNIHNLQGFSAAIWGMLAARGIPVVQTLHDHHTACANGVAYRHGQTCTAPCLPCRVLCTPRRHLSRRVDVLTVVSHRLRARVTGFGSFAGVRDSRIINGANLDIPLAEHRLPRADGPLRLGFLGRIDVVKGLETLLMAAQQLGPDRVSLRIGGTGEERYVAGLRARFGGPGIAWLGRVAPGAFFESIDALVVPSITEDSLPRVVHEAIGAGVPVIGAAIGGIPEMVTEGRTGFLVPAGDVTALEALLRRLIDTPPDWAAMAEACRAERGRYAFDRIFTAYRTAWMAAIAHRQAALPRNEAGFPLTAEGDAA